MKLFHVMSMGIACVTLATSLAGASVLFHDNFENVEGTATAFPNGDFGPYPIAQSGNWVRTDGSSPQMQVTKDYAPVEGQQALALRRTAGDNYSMVARFSPATNSASELVHVSFKYLDPTPDINSAGSQDRLVLTFQDQATVSWSNQVFSLNIHKWLVGSNNVAQFQSGSGSWPQWSESDPGTAWQQVDIWIDFINSNYTIELNGATALDSTDIAFDGDAADHTQIQQIVFSAYSSGSLYVIDDLRVEVVPEPAAVSLLLIGGMTMLGRRRSSLRA